MVDSLDCLRHDAVVGRHNDDGDVCHLRTTGTHRCKRLMTRCVEECDPLTVRKLYVVCTDMLCDTSGLTGNHVSVTDVVEEGSLTVVNVTHHGDHRWTWEEILLCILRLSLGDSVSKVRCHELYLISELLGDKHESLSVETLVDGYHHA